MQIVVYYDLQVIYLQGKWRMNWTGTTSASSYFYKIIKNSMNKFWRQ